MKKKLRLLKKKNKVNSMNRKGINVLTSFHLFLGNPRILGLRKRLTLVVQHLRS